MILLSPDHDYDTNRDVQINFRDFQDLLRGERWNAKPDDALEKIRELHKLKAEDILEEHKKRREDEKYWRIMDEEKEFQRLENRSPIRKKNRCRYSGGW